MSCLHQWHFYHCTNIQNWIRSRSFLSGQHTRKTSCSTVLQQIKWGIKLIIKTVTLNMLVMKYLISASLANWKLHAALWKWWGNFEEPASRLAHWKTEKKSLTWENCHQSRCSLHTKRSGNLHFLTCSYMFNSNICRLKKIFSFFLVFLLSPLAQMNLIINKYRFITYLLDCIIIIFS